MFDSYHVQDLTQFAPFDASLWSYPSTRTPGEWIRGYAGWSCSAAAKRGHAGGLHHR